MKLVERSVSSPVTDDLLREIVRRIREVGDPLRIVLFGSHARGYPPSPLTAIILPSFRSPAVVSIGSFESSVPSGRRSLSPGPHTGQAFGCAWYLRSSGVLYSFSHLEHISNTLIVVFFLSYGTVLTIVKRGPQFVQFVNGYPYLLSSGSMTSRRQSPQVAISGETGVYPVPSLSLLTIRKPLCPSGGCQSMELSVISASLGGDSIISL